MVSSETARTSKMGKGRKTVNGWKNVMGEGYDAADIAIRTEAKGFEV